MSRRRPPRRDPAQPPKQASATESRKDVLFLAPDWQRTGRRLSRLWHTASLYCRHVTSG